MTFLMIAMFATLLPFPVLVAMLAMQEIRVDRRPPAAPRHTTD